MYHRQGVTKRRGDDVDAHCGDAEDFEHDYSIPLFKLHVVNATTRCPDKD